MFCLSAFLSSFVFEWVPECLRVVPMCVHLCVYVVCVCVWCVCVCVCMCVCVFHEDLWVKGGAQNAYITEKYNSGES